MTNISKYYGNSPKWTFLEPISSGKNTEISKFMNVCKSEEFVIAFLYKNALDTYDNLKEAKFSYKNTTKVNK